MGWDFFNGEIDEILWIIIIIVVIILLISNFNN